MNGLEIIAKLKELEVDPWDFSEGYLDQQIFGDTIVVESEGGYEEGGSYVSRVVHFVKHDVYIRREGYYASYDGTDWEDYDYEEVKPAQKTITVYE